VTCLIAKKKGRTSARFFCPGQLVPIVVASVSGTTLQAISNNAELREALVLLVIADPVGHWYKDGTAA
jgi:hypothetical protein